MKTASQLGMFPDWKADRASPSWYPVGNSDDGWVWISVENGYVTELTRFAGNTVDWLYTVANYFDAVLYTEHDDEYHELTTTDDAAFIKDIRDRAKEQEFLSKQKKKFH